MRNPFSRNRPDPEPVTVPEVPARDPLRDQARDDARERDSAMSVAAISSERIEPEDNGWTRRLVLFLRVMAVISIVKGLYHWAQVTGFIGGEEEAFEISRWPGRPRRSISP